jgi:putative ABC transport system permease protein
MSSALTRYSWRQLSRHRARTGFTIATLAAAVLGVWLFAAPRNFDAAMNEQVEADVLHDAILRPDGVMLDGDDLAALRATSNIEHLDVRTTYVTEMRAGDRTQDVWLVGFRDFADQQVNIIDVDSGRAPETGGARLEALSDPVNGLSGNSPGDVGDTVMVRSARSGFEPLEITGEGTSVYFAHNASEWIPVLYVPVEVVRELAAYPDVFTVVEFQVADRDDAALAATVDSLRGQLADVKPSVRYNQLVEIRPAGEWPGQDDFDNFQVLFWVIAAVSLVSALVLVASTMTTLVREQTREIAIMKSVGGRRRRIIANYLTTSAFLGLAGTLLGTAIGLPITKLLTSYLGRFQGVDPGWRISWFALALSVAVGLGGTLLASMPALLRGTRITVRDAFDVGSDASYGRSTLDRMLSRARWLPRTAQLGLRAAARRKTRSVATQLQIALAVGTLLGFTALVITLIDVSEQSRMAEGGDIELYSSQAGRPLGNRAAELVAGIDGVDRVQPITAAEALVGDTDTFAWGLPPNPVFRYELSDGRWFSADENADTALVAVVGPALASIHDLEIGDTVRAETLGGPVALEVIGIDNTMVGDGQALFVPIETVMSLAGQREPTWFWITATSRDTGDIDRVATEIRETLDRHNYAYKADLRYLEREADRREDRTVVTIILALGIPIVAMGMIGLVSAMTTNIVERTREIGILRSIGARAKDIRRVFLAEAVTLVVAGWLAGIAVGYVIARIILRAMNNAFNVSFTLLYPIWPMAVALLVTLLVAMVVVRRPLRRAGRLPPSTALRYE